ncbi:NAD-dependent protein deacetylase sirtuin-2 isoform X3 [Rhincodon typus]|uniref:NAD-dependent protein deacetylase sirtuin-2 isoform X3 n=1 Tax=Rhincodon typus TaxID=259920 RepID=UPI00202FAA87|nr:NAD-dependent protein deacetylase sirtuin-2 isoform X3 [Rhincodon typus]
MGRCRVTLQNRRQTLTLEVRYLNIFSVFQNSESQGEASESPDVSEMDFLRNLLSRSLNLREQQPKKVLEDLSIEGIAKYILNSKCEKIICMVGAGISTSAGIPDFRSPGTGLYHNLQKYHLPYPEAIFETDYFKQHPEPFFALAKELYPGQFKPTVCHYFMRMLRDKGLLLRCYTQNIDTLERVVGLQDEDLIEAHGTFHTSHCTNRACNKLYSLEWMKTQIFTKPLPKCEECDSVVKPDIIFFGDSLPQRFFPAMESDFPKCDLLIIMGTSLQVQPFASLANRVSDTTPRLLINKEITQQHDPMMALLGLGSSLDFDSSRAYRDVAYVGSCDDGCLALADLLGWKEELEDIVKKEHAMIDSKTEGAQDTGKAPAADMKKDDPEARGHEPAARQQDR